MRITEAARRLGTSPRMLRYREELGLLPEVRDRYRPSRGSTHRQFSEEDLAAVAAGLELERRFDGHPVVRFEPPIETGALHTHLERAAPRLRLGKAR